MSSASSDVKSASLDALDSVPLFKGLEKAYLKALASSSKEMSFRPGDTIVKEGGAGLGFYLLIDGEATVRRKGKTVARLRKGNFFGEMALLDNQPRSADVIAETPTRCLVVLRWNFWSLLAKNKRMVRGVLEEMARRLRATNAALTE
jgi:CRP/FNR family transcriptional regulator, cyclic AMP receptor protein